MVAVKDVVMEPTMKTLSDDLVRSRGRPRERRLSPPPFREEATALTELGGVGVLWCERVSLPIPALDVPEHTLP